MMRYNERGLVVYRVVIGFVYFMLAVLVIIGLNSCSSNVGRYKHVDGKHSFDTKTGDYINSYTDNGYYYVTIYSINGNIEKSKTAINK